MTTRLAIQLWEATGQELTDAMREFVKRPSPYKEGYRHHAALEALQRGSPLDVESLITQRSTVSGGGTFIRAPRRKGPSKKDE